MISYESMNDNEKTKILKKLYEIEKNSFQDIANKFGTYANKIRRDAIKFKINIRDKSLAQKNALKSGKHCHPTKGKKRDESTKQKIGGSLLKVWDNLSETELNSRKQKAKTNWDNLSEDQKIQMQQKATKAVRITSKTGSKLEKFIFDRLLQDGHRVIFHQEQTLANTKLQIDIVIPNINVAIEVDGPSHFLPVWGEQSLQRNQKYDSKKEGLILGKGLVLIRIKQTMDFSKSRASLVYDKLSKILSQIKDKFPSVNNRSFIIEDK